MNYTPITNFRQSAVNLPNVGNGGVVYTASKTCLIQFVGSMTTPTSTTFSRLIVESDERRPIYYEVGSQADTQDYIGSGSSGFQLIFQGESIRAFIGTGGVASAFGTFYTLELD